MSPSNELQQSSLYTTDQLSITPYHTTLDTTLDTSSDGYTTPAQDQGSVANRSLSPHTEPGKPSSQPTLSIFDHSNTLCRLTIRAN